MPEKVNISNPDVLETEIIDIHDFNNAVEVMKKVKPHIVLANEFPSLVDLALDTAAKFFKIPVVTKVYATDSFKISKKQFFTSFLPLFFQSSLPYEPNQKKQFMRRGRFFLYKYLFLLKTLKATGMSLSKIIQFFFISLKWHISYETPYIDSRFASALHYLESEILVDRMVKAGYNKSSLIVTGNPMYDKAFKKYQNFNSNLNADEKIRILFTPLQYYEGGLWTKKERDDTIKEIIQNISKHSDEFSFAVKLHPSSQLYSDYESIIHEVNPSIPIYQTGVIEDYLDEYDVVVSFSPLTSASIYPLIARKPLVLCNFFNFIYKNKIEEGVAWECKDPTQLVQTIKLALSLNLENRAKIDQYLEKILYKTDGCASERLSDAVTKLIIRE